MGDDDEVEMPLNSEAVGYWESMLARQADMDEEAERVATWREVLA